MYAAADRLLEAADWSVWQLTGRETRNLPPAGYKAMWEKQRRVREQRVPGSAWTRGWSGVVDEKMLRDGLARWAEARAA